MSKHQSSTARAGAFGFAAGVAVTAICVAVALLLPTDATPQAIAAKVPSHAVAGDSGYLPAQVVNQAREIEPMPLVYY